ncbi:MAG TPA: UDP-N-acetylmuramate dehydrogenase [Polyangia bacterium]|nr:UDP-N-acetylmuramate dehydrogenase [Polyangia bacterium]
MSLPIRDDVPLAPLTTLELGGPARHLVEATDEATILEALAWAAARGVPAFVLGGGSNVVVADAGFPGLVVRVATRGRAYECAGGEVRLTAAAGEPWDGLVADTVARDLAGLECLSGIPGLAGATPVQNVGAYGQEVADTIRAVRVFDRRDELVLELPPSECAFGYRDSAFRRDPGRHVVLAVTFGLRLNGAPTLRYRELADALGGAQAPTLAATRDAVLALRRRKSMVIDPADPNRRSVGSFFTNPIVRADLAERLAARAAAEGVVASAAEVPRWAAGPGHVKLSAGWLIERSGISRGSRRGPVGVSSAHALALVHHGGGSTAELLSLARHVRDAVRSRFDVTLALEPVLVGATLD